MNAVVVEIHLTPGARADFPALVRENAATPLQTETGFYRFDVATDPSPPDEVLPDELYSDAAAFDACLATAHFASFGTAASKVIAGKLKKTHARVLQ
ncbi:MAG: antibiotic biosynthesis monooxygenase [Pseudomonadota bacterium]